ncbi:class I tRNA ligase family protein, partial [Candidatus Woesearchaeota archaeon]|nr:class I tRNA ligase family protein [Candidatus Woesearchaeota archaeon]
MKVPNYDFKRIETEMQEFWDKQGIRKKANAKNKDGKTFYFLDGPPYTSGKVHLGTAWNKSLKDTFIRYKRMKGFNIWDRAGYDMHGLPTEHATEKKLGINGKEEIIKMGVEAFIKECEKLCIENMRVMNTDFRRLGVWMDFENAYQSIKPEFIEGVWWVVKKAHEQGRLYEGLRTMPWCPTCASAVAKHELEYKNVTDTSIFVKLKITGTPNDYLIIWTTTPWTIPYNLGVMVNPEIEYVKCKVDSEHWWVAKTLANVFVTSVAGKNLEIVEEILGAELEGIAYEHPFADVIPEYARIKKKSPKAHTVLLSSEYVDTTAGTGLVHCAPGCGPEDYEVGHRNKIPAYNTTDERGVFPQEMREFAGFVARADDKKFIEALRTRGAIIAKNPVQHDYAHCWRCHYPVLVRTP